MAPRFTKPTQSRKPAPKESAAEFSTNSNGAAARKPTVEDIRTLAYHKWVAAGGPPGDGVDFWLKAEQELNYWNHGPA